MGAGAIRRRRSGGALLLWAALLAGPVQGAEAQEHSPELRAYLRSVAVHFDQDAGEVLVLLEGASRPEELPVALLVASRSGVSPEAVLALRRSGRSWAELLRAYGMHAGQLYVPLDAVPEAGPLAQAYGAFADRSRESWPVIRLPDEAVIALVHLRFLAGYLEVPPDRVAQALAGSPTPVSAYRTLLRPAFS